MTKIVFFLGKGGVGKTTSSAVFAYYLANKGKSVYWMSIDPAHNICDVIDAQPFKGVKNIYKSLFAEEIDVDNYLKNFIKKTTKNMKETYKYLQIINLDKMFEVMKYSPGMEEYAIMYALKDKIEQNTDKDYIIIDTPPTGLMLKIFALPFTSQLWIEKLTVWRKKIINQRSAIANINADKIDKELAIKEEDDKVLKELGMQSSTVTFLTKMFQNKKTTKTVIVLNQDEMSLNESKKIKQGLDYMDIPLNLVIVNKKGMTEVKTEVESYFKDVHIEEMGFVKSGRFEPRNMSKTVKWTQWLENE